ncbi:unnamed protein product [Pleuronectes platessa]|uniref:Uncharacterized protein n=1 Tax=Pleuronectes platessa TaxID=8262 RepID=A0A9N7YK73_PLEPL|nr:unnamed protein product [Pleuronectes platessa]
MLLINQPTIRQKEEHTSKCTIVCPERVALLEVVGRERVAPLEVYVAEIKKTTSRFRFIPVIIIISSVIVLLVVFIYFRRKRTCFASPVNMKGVEEQAPVGE